MKLLTRQEVFHAIENERNYQSEKWGRDKQQSLLGFITIMRKELQEAEDGWYDAIASGRNSPLNEIVQVAATAVACLEKYGIEGNVISRDDTPYIGK